MRRTFLFLLFATATGLFNGCGPQSTDRLANQAFPFSVVAELGGLPPGIDSARIVQNYAGQEITLTSAAVVPHEGGFRTELKGTVPHPGLYTLQLTPILRYPLILGVDDAFELAANPQRPLEPVVVKGSEENSRFYTYTRESRQLQRVFMLLYQQPDPEQRRALADSAWQAQRTLHQQLSEGMQVLPVLFATNEVMPYELADTQGLSTKAYYLKAIFQNDSLQNSTLGFLPGFFEKSKAFGNILVQEQVPDAEAFTYIDSVLALMPLPSPQAEVFLVAISSNLPGRRTLQDGIHQRYLTHFPNGIVAAQVKQSRTALEGLRPGDEAPAITLPTREGKTIALSSLRGQYVLIDFWAAWCGPCRRENPNVVRLYNRYHAKGFEIYGISLDESKDAWLKAIAEDKLPWVHVSDLKGWQCEAAQRYGVQAIPATVLLDKEGRILAWDLRGEALAKKLAELFEEA